MPRTHTGTISRTIENLAYGPRCLTLEVEIPYTISGGESRTWDYPGSDPDCEFDDAKIKSVTEWTDNGESSLEWPQDFIDHHTAALALLIRKWIEQEEDSLTEATFQKCE